MSLKDLSKEQRQYLVLGALAAAILVIILVLGIRFSLSSVTDAKSELADLTEKIETADRTLGKRDQISGDFLRTMKILKQHLKNAPPERNYYSWASEVVYSEAKIVGLEIDTIDELSSASTKAAAQGDDVIQLEAYALRIAAHGSFEGVKMFIEGIKQNYPLVRFTGMDINTSNNPDIHDVQLWMQWPFNLGAIAEKWKSVESKQQAMDDQKSNDSLAVEAVVSSPVQSSVRSEPLTVPATASTQSPVAEESTAPKPAAEPAIAAEPKPLVKREPTPPPPRVAKESEASLTQEVSGQSAPAEPRPMIKPEPEPSEPQVSAEPEPVAVPAEPIVPPVVEVQPEPIVVPEPVEEPQAADVPATNEPVMESASNAATSSEEVASTAADQDEVQNGSARVAQDNPTEANESPIVPVAASLETPPQDSVSSAAPMENTEDSSNYVATEKSAHKLEDLLLQQNSVQTNETLSSLLDSLMDAAYENP